MSNGPRAQRRKEDRVLALLSLADPYGGSSKPRRCRRSAQKALVIDPANGRALAALVSLYTEKQDFASLIAV